MAFVYEKVPEKDYDFFKSMGLKNCWGNKSLHISSHTFWVADRERNAFLVGIGGGRDDMPCFYDFWWNGHTVRMDIWEAGSGNYENGFNIVWNILKLPIPNEIWEYKNKIIIMIKEAFSVDTSWYNPERVNSVDVDFRCLPEIAREKEQKWHLFLKISQIRIWKFLNL